MTSARELFDRGMREHFAPALRAMGLTGWRHSFSLPDETYWAVLGVEWHPSGMRIHSGSVERPGSNTRMNIHSGAAERHDSNLGMNIHSESHREHEIRYTVNLGLTAKADWRGPGLRPDPNRPTGRELWRAPIGELLPVGEPLWWSVAPGPRWLVAVEDSVAAVRHYGLPELVRRVGADQGTESYLSPGELEDVNAAMATAAVARIRRAELADKTLVLTGGWSRADRVAEQVLRGVAEGFLSAGDERFTSVRCEDTLGRELWIFDQGDLEPPGPLRLS
ncbi:hypothetical protein ABT095_25895 [Kitasatospora sp. NPDC002227]|uniref:hypothetical protein n=1 Tax=Kitasatospora sp. NPDC002227 TaxID=3154773 RepID=UPI0033332EBB